MEVAATRFSNSVYDDRPLGVVRAVIRGQDLKLLNHIRIGIDGRSAVATRVRNVSAVRGNINILHKTVGASLVRRSCPVGDIAAVERTLTSAIAVAVDA